MEEILAQMPVTSVPRLRKPQLFRLILFTSHQVTLGFLRRWLSFYGSWTGLVTLFRNLENVIEEVYVHEYSLHRSFDQFFNLFLRKQNKMERKNKERFLKKIEFFS